METLVRHALDTADKNVLANLNPFLVTFKDVKKFDAQNTVLGNLLTQIEGRKLLDEEIKKQLGKIKDNKIQTRLDLLRRSGNIKDDKNKSNFPPNNPPDIPPGFPSDFPFDHLPPPDSPTFPSAPPFPTAPPFPSFPPPPPPFAPFTPSAPPPPDYHTTFAEKIALADSDPKIRIPQKPKVTLMPKVVEIPKAEEKITVSEPLNQLFDDEKTDEEPKTEFLLPKQDEIMEEINKSNIPPQLDFFVGERNLEFQNRIMQLGIDEDTRDFLAFLQTEMCKQVLLRNKLKKHVETGNIFYNNQNTNESIYDFFFC